MLSLFDSIMMRPVTALVVVAEGCSHLGDPHEGLVVLDALHGVVELPAIAAKVLEARQFPAGRQD